MVLRLRSHLCPKLGQTTWDTVMLWGGFMGSRHANLPFAVQGADWRDNGAQAEWDWDCILIQFSSLLLLIS